MKTIVSSMMGNCLYDTRVQFERLFPAGMEITLENLEKAARFGISNYHFSCVLNDEIYAEYEIKRARLLNAFIDVLTGHFRNFTLNLVQAAIESRMERTLPRLREALLNALLKQPEP